MDAPGNPYAVNKDDDNVISMSPAGMTSVLIADGLDDSRVGGGAILTTTGMT